jgi:hypothetical protein
MSDRADPEFLSDDRPADARKLLAVPVIARSMALDNLSDDELIDHVDNLEVERQRANAHLGGMILEAKSELTLRLTQRGAREIAHKEFEVGLEPEFSAYAYDLEALAKAKTLLPDVEGAKVVKLIPRLVTVVEEHLEPGLPVSITALKNKYSVESEVGKLLDRGMSRSSLGVKFYFRRRKVKK